MKSQNFKLKISFFTLTVLSLILCFCNGHAQWWERTICYGDNKTILCMASSGSTIFAGTEASLYRSINNGENWTLCNTGLTNLTIKTIYVKESVIFVSDYYSSYRSTDNGDHWIKITNFGPAKFSSNSLFTFATVGNTFYRSPDNGVTWKNISTDNLNANNLVANDNVIFIGSYYYGIIRSTNNGTSWINLGFSRVTCLTMQENTVFAGTRDSGLFRSTNNGLNWLKINNGTIDPRVECLASDDSTIIVGAKEYKIYRSTNKGENWTDISIQKLSGAICFTLNGSSIFTGTFPNGIYRSTNNGSNWSEPLYTLTDDQFSCFTTIGNTLFAASNYAGVYNSTNNGFQWHPNSYYNLNINTRALVVTSEGLLAGTISGVYKTTNQSYSWSEEGLIGQSITCFAKNGGNLFAGTDSSGIFHSPKIGYWVPTSNGLTNLKISSIIFDSTNVYAGTAGGMFVSTDNGGYWSSINSGLPTLPILSIAVNGSNVYSGTNGGGVFRSINKGGSWESINNGLRGSVIFSLLTYGNDIIAGTNRGVYLSHNNGNNWINRNLGLDSLSEINSLFIFNNYLYVGVHGDVIWRCYLPVVLNVENTSNQIPDKFYLSQNYPNPFNPMTKINYQLQISNYVILKVFDIAGKEVATLVNQKQNAGTYQVTFNSTEYNLPSGVYFYRLETERFSETKKMVLLK